MAKGRLVNHNINNLSGGVSRQPDEARFDNQVEEMNNFEPFVTGSIRRRNPLNFVANLSPHKANMIMHSYDRGDGSEKYGMILDDNGIRVYDITGVQKTVTQVGTVDVMSKWTGTDWNKDIKFLTVGDTTWILNQSKTVKITESRSPNLNTVKKAFYWLKRSFDDGVGGGYKYYLYINGVTYSVESGDSKSGATELAALVNAISGFTAKASGSIVYIVGDAPFTFSFSDSWGDQASVGWSESIDKITDLPASMEAFTREEVGVIGITGTDRDKFTSYYLSWDGDSWIESVATNIPDELDMTTLPAKLVRIDNNNFYFGFNEDIDTIGFYTNWEKRLKGDESSNPLPSFVGQTISNLFFFRNRLGFASEENVILSEVSSYYNFFATTMMDVLDGDPIDVSVDSDSVAIIRNVNSIAGSLTLWADGSQYILSGGDVLSPATTRVSQSSSYACDNSIAPIVVDNEILFFNKIDKNLEVKVYSASSLDTDKSSAESISTNVTGYLPSTINNAIVSSASNLVFLTDGADSNTIYVYKYHINNNEKIMSSWFKWTFGVSIKGINVVDNTLYLLVDGNGLAKMELSITDINDSFLDMGTDEYISEVTLSRFNIETKQGTRSIREPFFVKNLKVSYEGICDLDIINSERNNVKTIKDKHLDRRLFIGGNSDKVSLKFQTNYDLGCKINTISLEGLFVSRSQNA